VPHQIEIDDDIYEALRRSVRDFGETPTAVLRRVLDLPAPTKSPTPNPQAAANGSKARRLLDFVTEARFRSRGTATEKYLEILSVRHSESPDEFERILQVSGRERRYFGRSRKEITDSGTSTHPRAIPGTEYWAMTNADTPQKREILGRVLRLLGFSSAEIESVTSAVN
jgi:negative modulator of initiation of replication